MATRWPVVISVFALIVSVGSAALTYWTHSETGSSNAIKEAYSTYFELDRLELDNWQLSHLFATPNRYKSVKTVVQQSLKSTPRNIHELDLKERALASHIFDSYEETLFLLEHAKKSKESEQVRFLQLVADYFNERLLRNPRLLYYWPILSGDYEETTRQSYEMFVLRDANHPLTSAPDDEGPITDTARVHKQTKNLKTNTTPSSVTK